MATTTHAISKHIFKALTVGACITFSSPGFAGFKYDKVPRASADRPVSSLQIVNHIERKYKNKGKGIGMKKTPTEKFPDCFVVHFMTHEGELDIIKINCK